MAFNLGDVVAHIRVKSDEFEKGLNKIQGDLKSVSTKVLLLETAAVASMAALGVSSLKTAAQFEQFRVSFETMLGSADKARSLLKDIVNFTKKTPFELPQVVEGARRLLAFGISSEDVMKNLKSLGDIASGVGMDKLPQLILAFGQVKAATKLTGNELRQFTEAGVPLLEQLAKTSGKSAAQIKEDMAGGVAPSFEDVQRALEDLTGPGGRFFDLMEKQSGTLDGTISNLKDSFTLFGLSIAGVTTEGDIIAGGFFDKVRNAAVRLYEWVNNNQVAINEFGAKLGNFVVTAGRFVIDWLKAAYTWWNNLSASTRQVIVYALGISAAIVALLPLLLGLTTAISVASTTFRILGAVIGFLASPIGIVIGLLAIIGGSIYVIARNWKGAMQTLSIYWSILTQSVSQAWFNLKRTLGNVFEGITSPFRRAFDYVKNGVGSVVDRLKSLNPFTRHSPSLVDMVTRGTKAITGQYSDMFNSIEGFATNLRPALSLAAPEVVTNNMPAMAQVTNVSIQAGAFMGTPGDARAFSEMVMTQVDKIKSSRGGTR